MHFTNSIGSHTLFPHFKKWMYFVIRKKSTLNFFLNIYCLYYLIYCNRQINMELWIQKERTKFWKRELEKISHFNYLFASILKCSMDSVEPKGERSNIQSHLKVLWEMISHAVFVRKVSWNSSWSAMGTVQCGGGGAQVSTLVCFNICLFGLVCPLSYMETEAV